METISRPHFFSQLIVWYIFSIMFNVEVKRLFIEYNIPWTVSLVNFSVAFMGGLALMGRPTAKEQSAPEKMIPTHKLVIIGLLQFIGNFSTNMSIAAMSVSFTHVIKALEVIFVLGWSFAFVKMGVMNKAVTPSLPQMVVILLVTIGVIITSLQEATFSWHGFVFGMLANVGFSGRNTLAKLAMTDYTISKEKLFVAASFVSCLPCILPVIVYELPILNTMPKSAFLSLFYTGVMFFMYNIVSFTVLEGVSPVTHAIANCCKRLVLVVASIIIFRTTMQPLSFIGSLLAIFGIAMYSQLGTNMSWKAILRKNIVLVAVGTVIAAGCVLYLPSASTSGAFNPPIVPDIPNKFPEVHAELPVEVQAEVPIGLPEIQVENFPPPPPPPSEPEVAKVVEIPVENSAPVFSRRGNSDMIARLQEEIIAQVGPHFRKFKRAVIVDVPNHDNKGDSAIYTGEDIFLNMLNVQVIHICETAGPYGCDSKRIADMSNPQDTVICLHGGGNFGDLWPWFEQSRNKWLTELRAYNFSFVLFPQTITYTNMDNFQATKQIFDDTPNLVLTVRDKPSFAFIQEHFPQKQLVYTPDMAWMNGHKSRVMPPKYDILFFIRTDKEGVQVQDVVAQHVAKIRPGLNYHIDDWTAYDVDQAQYHSLEGLGYARFYSGLDFLFQGKVVVTNRLHGHILSVLSDLPHVIMDNIYGKVFNAHSAWTMEAENVEVASNATEAVEKAIQLLDKINSM